jgi:hypothetical protein
MKVLATETSNKLDTIRETRWEKITTTLPEPVLFLFELKDADKVNVIGICL